PFHPIRFGWSSDGDPAWRTADDLGASSPRTIDHGDCSACWPRSKDGAQIYRAQARTVGLWSTPRRSTSSSLLDYLRERIAAFPDLTAMRLTREIRERGYSGAYTAVKRFVAAIRPNNQPKPLEVRFETPPGCQAQVDFARFVTTFTDDPEMCRIVWLFPLV